MNQAPQVLQPIGDDVGNTIMRWPVPADFPAGPSMPFPPGGFAPPRQPQCWTPYGVTWFKPAPGGPILYGPGGSYVAPAPQLPTASRGPVVQGAGVAIPGPGGANGEQMSALEAGPGVAPVGRGAWLVLLAVAAGVAWVATRKRKGRA